MPRSENIKHIIDNKKGFVVNKISNNDDLIKIKNFILKDYKKEIQKFTIKKNIINNIENYHLLNLNEKIHKRIWTRDIRRASSKLKKQIVNTSFFSKIEKIYGKLTFSDMVEKGKPDIFWRLVRPMKKKDVGPIHADSWFWKANNIKIKKGYKTLKFWMMISSNCHQGLGVIPFSQHKKKWVYDIKYSDGLYKPNFKINKNKFRYKPRIIKTDFSDYILFNYDLLHYGALNTTNVTRCSLEMTFLYKT